MQVPSMRISTIVLPTLTRISGRAYPVPHAPPLYGGLGKSMQPQPLLKKYSWTRIASIVSIRLWYSPERERRKKTWHKKQEREFLKRIGNIDGEDLYFRVTDKENILGAIKDASKDHSHDPQVI